MSAVATSFSAVALAQEIYDVATTVRLFKDGSATITQIWDADVVSGTEWYMPIKNSKNMNISEFRVSENGSEFIDEGRNWDVDRSIDDKAGRSGIVEKPDGIELCWGQGSYGRHVWTSSYKLSGLVQAMDDYDGFNHQFVNPGLISAPQHISLKIINETGGPEWTTENTRVWAFGFEGQIHVTDGQIIAESSEIFSRESSVIAMVSFEKGMFEPKYSRDMTFETMKNTAFTGSSYSDSDSSTTEDKLIIFGIFLALISSFFGLIWMVVQKLTGHKYKKSMFGERKIKGWYREAPLDSSLEAGWYVFSNGFRFNKEAKPEDLIGAYFLRWILKGQVTVIKNPDHPKRVSLKFMPDADIETDSARCLYDMAMTASGDNILETSEFKSWSKKHYQKIMNWPAEVESEGEAVLLEKGYRRSFTSWTQEGIVAMRHVIEFRNFLNDFTLSSEREANEVGLWKDYLVYAQMFGIADKVARQFRKLYPDIMQKCASSVGMDVSDLMNVVLINKAMTTSAFSGARTRMMSSEASKGLGGFTSSGGGGGFSGGGFGGGSR